MKLYLAPEKYDVYNDRVKIFLAGSIEMGKAEDWQTKVTKSLEKYNVDVLNPRRTDWDSSWEQKITNPQFHEQVTWELDSLENADYIVLYLQPGTISPISLLEFGLFCPDMLVCCPEGFHRKGNVDIVCERYEIPLFESLDDLIEELHKKLIEDHRVNYE